LLVSQNEGVLLANLFPRDTVAGEASDSPYSWAFHNGIYAAQFSALWGWPTVSARFSDDAGRWGALHGRAWQQRERPCSRLGAQRQRQKRRWYDHGRVPQRCASLGMCVVVPSSWTN